MLSVLPRISLCFLALAAIAPIAHALDQANLAEAFVRRLAVNEEFIELAEFEQEGAHTAHLLRWQYDLNRDGVEDHFFATTLQSERRGVEWTVYLSQENESYYPARDYIFFHPELVHERVTESKNELTTFIRSDNRNANITGYAVDDAGQIERSSRELTDQEIEHLDSLGGVNLAELFSLGNALPCSIEKVLLADFLTSGNPAWRPYDMEHSPDQQYLDPEDDGAIQRLSSVSIGDCLRELAIRPASSSVLSSAQAQRNVLRRPRTSPTEDRDTNLPVAHIQSDFATWKIVLISMLLMGASLLFFWLRSKKVR